MPAGAQPGVQAELRKQPRSPLNSTLTRSFTHELTTRFAVFAAARVRVKFISVKSSAAAPCR